MSKTQKKKHTKALYDRIKSQYIEIKEKRIFIFNQNGQKAFIKTNVETNTYHNFRHLNEQYKIIVT